MKATNIDNLSPGFLPSLHVIARFTALPLPLHPGRPSDIVIPIYPTINLFLCFLLFLMSLFFPRRLPDFKQRIADQSLPFEDFAIHKANKYFEQNGRLFLPGVVSPTLFDILLTLYSITSVGIFSTLFSIHSSRC